MRISPLLAITDAWRGNQRLSAQGVRANRGAWGNAYFGAGRTPNARTPLHLLSKGERDAVGKRLQIKLHRTQSERKSELAARGIFTFAGAAEKLQSKTASAVTPQQQNTLEQLSNRERIDRAFSRYAPKDGSR